MRGWTEFVLTHRLPARVARMLRVQPSPAVMPAPAEPAVVPGPATPGRVGQ
jgi:hypothetical protein